LALATGAEASERIAEATGLLPSTVFRTARLLREADKGLWPEAGKGGGRAAAHVELSHLVNLTIALAVEDPSLAVAKAIRAYRALVPHRHDQHVLAEDDIGLAANLLMTNDMFNGSRALGAELERLIDLLTKGDSARTLESAGLYAEFFIELRVPRVGVGYHQFDLPDDTRSRTVKLLYRKPNIPPSLSGQLDPYRDFLSPRLITRAALLPCALFTAMADLWSHTRQHQAITAARRSRRPTVLMKE
jgi:hypothetical protein